MYNNNPYVNTLIEMGYDEQDCNRPAAKMEFPCTIHGREYTTEEEYLTELHEFMNGM